MADEEEPKTAFVDESAVPSAQASGEENGSLGNSWSEVSDMRQGLHQRHVQMISIAGTIGTGLFLGSGTSLARAGPVGALLGYTIIGAIVCNVVLAVGEMGALLPLSGGIVRYTETFVDPALSFAIGWNQVYSGCKSTFCDKSGKAATLIQWWITINNAVWIVVFGSVMTVSTLLFVRVYGEMEFFFATLKICLIIIVNVTALVVVCGGGPNGVATGFTYWRNPGPFVQYLGIEGALGRFLGFWTTFSNAAYAYAGSDSIVVAAAETRNPRQTIPHAAKRVFARVAIFYIITIFFVGLLVPSDNEQLLSASGTAASPFVIGANIARIPVLPSVINAIVITSAWSSGNAGMLNNSRYLFGMAKHGHAPKIFLRLNRFGVPYCAVLLITLFMSLAFMSLSKGAATVFTWLQSLVSIGALITWTTISVTYLRFYYGCKAQGIDRNELPWKSPFQPYAIWASLFFLVLIMLTSGYKVFLHDHWATESFISSYINIPIFLVLYLSYKFINRTNIIPLSEIPIRPLLEHAQRFPEPPEEPKQGWKKLNIFWN
ncbi:unnamed protein product [Clonostachys solani]|uniref:Amino acid permease/ SLC12A domain-containing protein n=1 Tax=Clonostachys solani TaxID=160281 RepID=A0A9N9ZFV6_9HYPO|nr:unnamed protein product [Clonostachys solani]